MRLGELLVAAAILAGAAALGLDLANRLFASYRRTPARAAWRIAAVVLAVLLLTAPLWVPVALPGLAVAARLRMPFGVIAALVLVHFLVPYRRGIKRLASGGGERALSGVVVLRDRRVVVARQDAVPARLSCLILSDLHCNGPRRLQALRECCRALSDGQEADCVLVLGDFGERAELIEPVSAALASVRSRFGTFCVRGNHDFEGGRAELIASQLRRHGIRLLGNEVYVLPGSRVALVGLEPPWTSPDLTDVPAGALRVGLVHTPDGIRHVERLGLDVAVAGHTHGGRLQLPLVGPLLVPARHGRFLDRGLFRRGRTLLYVTEGLGYHTPFFRRGEVTRLVVEAKPSPAESVSRGDRT